MIVLGCMDPLSCNYNPSANVNVPELCCYPGFCNDRLLSEVCPDLKKNVSDEALDIQVFPNPVHDKLRISFVNDEMHTSCIQVYNGLARLMKEFTISPLHDPVIILEVSDLPNGIYVLRYQCNAEQKIQKFIKE